MPGDPFCLCCTVHLQALQEPKSIFENAMMTNCFKIVHLDVKSAETGGRWTICQMLASLLTVFVVQVSLWSSHSAQQLPS